MSDYMIQNLLQRVESLELKYDDLKNGHDDFKKSNNFLIE